MHPIQVREGFALGGLPANSSKSAEDDYWRLAAEAEARNVQHRADMSMDERLTLPPWVTQDVPTKQQIVRFGDGPAMAIPFWHGSPHKYDAVDLSKIGTGEGAQAYGHGYYGGQAKETGEEYARTLSNIDRDTGYASSHLNAQNVVARTNGDPEWAAEVVADQLSRTEPSDSAYGKLADTLEIIKSGKYKEPLPDSGYLYRGEYRWPDPAKEAATPLTGEDLLQWDRPLSEQPESVRRAVSELGIVGGNMELPAGGLDMSGGGRILDNRDGKVKPGSVAPYVLVSGDNKFDISEKDLQRMLGGSDDPTGEQIYTRLTAKLGDQNAASKALGALGAPGIRYLDGMSRDGGQGTYNYVMFDDKGIKLLERNGSPIEDFAARRAGKAKPYKESLPMDEASRMQRAQEMGFDTSRTVYHGAPDIRGMDEGFVSKSESLQREGYGNKEYQDPNRAFFFADDISTAKTYADDRRAFDYQNADPGVIAAHLRMDNPMVIDWGGKPWRGTQDAIQQARENGHDGIVINNVIDAYQGKGKPTTVRVVFNPEQIRKTDAAFDPAKKDSANLLAGLAALGVGTAAVKSQQEKERRNGL
jgi:hypothetical protein